MRKFDYSFLQGMVPASIMNLSNIIYDIKGKEESRLKGNGKLYESLRKKAIVESIKASNAIENIVTTEKRIREIADGDAPRTHDEKEITGYRNVLNMIHNNSDTIIFDETTILNIHKEMLDVANTNNRGKYKKEVNIITETINGRQYVRFVPISPADTKEAMNQLILAYYAAKRNENISPLLLIPCVILDFLSIHPFDDGNGRMSRLLTLLLLYKHGFDIGRFISIENVINESKDQYYRVLQESSINWHENQNDYYPFITYMIQVLYKCYQKLDTNVISQIDNKMTKTERIEYVLMNSIVPTSKAEIIDKLPDISTKTIELVISNLLKNKKINKIGTFKDAKYYRL